MASLLRKIPATKVQQISKVSRMVLSPISSLVPKSAPTLMAATFGVSPVLAIAISRNLITGARPGWALHLDKSHVVDHSLWNVCHVGGNLAVNENYFMNMDTDAHRYKIYGIHISFGKS